MIHFMIEVNRFQKCDEVREKKSKISFSRNSNIPKMAFHSAKTRHVIIFSIYGKFQTLSEKDYDEFMILLLNKLMSLPFN